jgi:hypothetical protein
MYNRPSQAPLFNLAQNLPGAGRRVEGKFAGSAGRLLGAGVVPCAIGYIRSGVIGTTLARI